jgi:hypothetical protein
MANRPQIEKNIISQLPGLCMRPVIYPSWQVDHSCSILRPDLAVFNTFRRDSFTMMQRRISAKRQA